MASGSSSQEHQFPSHGPITMPSPLPEPMTPLTQFIDVCEHVFFCFIIAIHSVNSVIARFVMQSAALSG